jgi:proteasomal ATPase-like protein
MMCTVVKKLGKELEPATYPAGANFVHRVLVKTDTGVEARADISDRLYEKVRPGDRLRFLDTRNAYRAFPRVRASHRTGLFWPNPV